MPNQKLLEFITEARKKGFEDWQIREPLLKHGWPKKEIKEAFACLKHNKKAKNKKPNIKNAITIYLDADLAKIIEKRAKKNMLNFNEQVEDILRRSCLSMKKQKIPSDKDLDDKFIALFSRKNTGRPKRV